MPKMDIGPYRLMQNHNYWRLFTHHLGDSVFVECRLSGDVPGCLHAENGHDITIGLIVDVIVYGKTKEEDDSNLHNLMRIARTEGLCFNSEKCVIDKKKQKTNTFFLCYLR